MADLEGLRQFAMRSRGRDSIEFFEGRVEEQALAAELCEAEVDRRSRPGDGCRGANGILLFSGCPGMGKSALLRKIGGIAGAEQPHRPPGWLARAARKPNPDFAAPPLVVEALPDDLTSTENLLRLCGNRARLLRDQFPIGIRNALESAEKARTTAAAMDFLNAVNLSQRPLVLLLVDEVQTSTEANRAVYSLLQKGLSPLPIMPVFAGLSDSSDVLSGIGVSRLGDGMERSLGLLSREACRESMNGMLARFEIRCDREPWLDMAGRASHCFPQHLNGVLVATAKIALQNQGRLAAVDLQPALALSDENRFAYYESRSGVFTQGELKAAAHVVRLLSRGGDPNADPAILAARPLAELARAKNRSPETEEHPDAFVARMLHSGLLQRAPRAEGGGYKVPIPSFETWLVDHYGDSSREPTESAGDGGVGVGN